MLANFTTVLIGLAPTLQPRIQEMLSSNLGRDLGNPAGFRRFPQFLHVNATIAWLGQNLFPPHSLQFISHPFICC
jgi:hypothetical protein